MDTTFRIRYRAYNAAGASSALVVEDREGVVYLFSGGRLQLRLNPLTGWQRMNGYMERAHYSVQPIDNGDFHSLETLSTLEQQSRHTISPCNQAV